MTHRRNQSTAPCYTAAKLATGGTAVHRDIEIRALAQHEGETVRLRGWVQRKTGKGRLHFIRLRDGSGVAQCVAFRDDLDPESFATVRELTQESAIVIEGVVRADERAPGFPGGYEIGMTGIQLLQRVEDFPHHAQSAWHRILDGPPPPLAALLAAMGNPPHPRPHHPRHAGLAR